MEISVIKTNYNDKGVYGGNFSETSELSLLNLFLTSDAIYLTYVR